MKKAFAVLLSVLMIASASTGVLGAGSISVHDSQNAVLAINDIIDRVNSEYGMDFFIPSPQEARNDTRMLQSNGMMGAAIITEDSIRASNLSQINLAQFEADLRASAAFLAEERAMAEAAWERSVAEYQLPENQLPLMSESVGSIRLYRSMTRRVTGASIYFGGWANNHSGFWTWEFYSLTRVTADSGPNHSFVGRSYSVSFIDARRTAAVRYVGTMYTRTGTFWIPSSHTHHVEWHAR